MQLFDFTWAYYENLLSAFKNSGYAFSTVNDFLGNKTSARTVILRHDIDRRPDLAQKMASFESNSGIRGTYYFRAHPISFNKDVIKNIHNLGHEIGYHYEDLTKNHGDYERAIQSFGINLENFRSVVPITTICMDGRPLSPYNNLDLWKKYDFSQYNLKGEPYLNFDFERMLYLTDTSRGWNKDKYNIKDKVKDNFNYLDRTTKQLISDIEAGHLPDQVMLTIHPQRWHEKTLPWLKEYLFQSLKNTIKWGVNHTRSTKWK